MSGVDIVAATRRCAVALEDLGLAEWSRRLTDAVDAASTGGELVMAVRWHLEELKRSGVELPEDVEDLIQEIIREVNKSGW